MEKVVRFGVSIESDLVEKFDKLIKKEKYPNRSEALRDLMREKLVKAEWIEGKKQVAGVVTIVYDHHKRDVRNKLEDVQHNFHALVVAAQHIHLDHDNCLEMIVIRGNPVKVQDLGNRLKAVKGVKYGHLSMATTGKRI